MNTITIHPLPNGQHRVYLDGNERAVKPNLLLAKMAARRLVPKLGLTWRMEDEIWHASGHDKLPNRGRKAGVPNKIPRPKSKPVFKAFGYGQTEIEALILADARRRGIKDPVSMSLSDGSMIVINRGGEGRLTNPLQ